MPCRARRPQPGTQLGTAPAGAERFNHGGVQGTDLPRPPGLRRPPPSAPPSNQTVRSSGGATRARLQRVMLQLHRSRDPGMDVPPPPEQAIYGCHSPAPHRRKALLTPHSQRQLRSSHEASLNESASIETSATWYGSPADLLAPPPPRPYQVMHSSSHSFYSPTTFTIITAFIQLKLRLEHCILLPLGGGKHVGQCRSRSRSRSRSRW